ncbi:MAG: hypothetical protein PHC69_02670 [Ruminiclostridium sp.]|nr:hypothetical protein [Ruminiclostridium sp.]
MASIEYGIDGYGRKVWPIEARSGRTYTCPYCFDEIHVRKCCDREDYFAHKSIANRTPQQMICPGYTGEGAYRRIEGKVDRIYITNGGLPLYLCEYMKGKYQLNAYFPPLSRNNMDLLESWDTKIEVTEHNQKEEYSARNIRYYRLKTNAEWIKIKCKSMAYTILEVQQKWEWGIRGLNCGRDIFHSNYGGGYRVALHSNIVAGKEYLIISRYGRPSKVEGIRYLRKGSMKFNNLYGSQEYDVYAIVVEEITDDAIAYIQSKGYQIIEQSDEMIPMWPPAVIEGKELIYRKTGNKAYLYHNKRSEQRLFSMDNSRINSIAEEDNIFEVSTNNKAILLSDYQFNSLSNEIKFMLTQIRDNFENKSTIIPSITWADDKGVLNQLSAEAIELLRQRKVFIDSDVDFVACIVKGVYVEKSSKRVLEDIHRSKKIIISMGPFGTIIIEEKKAVKKETESKSNIDIDSVIMELYRCNSARVPINKDFYHVYKFAANHSARLFRILESWAVKNEMPYAAANYLYKIREVLKNE